MTDINEIYKQYQALQETVSAGEEKVTAWESEVSRAKENLGNLEKSLTTGKKVLGEKESSLSEAISTQIGEQRVVLTRANRMLKKGNVKNAYLVFTGQEPEEKADDHPAQLVQVASPEVAIRMATGRLYGIDRESGESLWKYDTPSCLPVFAQDKDRVFVADYKTLVSLDRKSGREISRERIADRYLEALLQDEGVLFVASEDDVSAYDVNSLQKIWEERIPDNLELAKSGENLFACGYRGLFAIDPKTGKVKWDNSGRTYHIAGGANNEGSVYTANCWGGGIRKLDRDGKQVWENRDDIPVAVMKANNGTLYVASKFGQVSALESETGKQMWRSERIGDYAFPWQIGEAQDRLEVTVTEPYYARESKVISLNPKTGKQI
jgi:outer membrane protein assembly factor BamB